MSLSTANLMRKLYIHSDSNQMMATVASGGQMSQNTHAVETFAHTCES